MSVVAYVFAVLRPMGKTDGNEAQAFIDAKGVLK